MSSLREKFKKHKPAQRKNFVHENVRQLREMQSCYQTDIQSQVSKMPKVKQSLLTKRNMESAGRLGELYQPSKLSKNTMYSRTVHIPKLMINKQTNKINRSPPRRNRLGAKLQKDLNAHGTSASVKHYGQRQINVKDQSSSTTDITSDNFSSPSSSESNIVLREIGCQTLEPNEVAILYQNGVIICPTIKTQNDFKSQKGPDSECIENVPPSYKPYKQENQIVSYTNYGAPGDVRNNVDPLHIPLSNMSITGDSYAHTGCGDKHEEVDFVKLNTKVVMPRNKTNSVKAPDPTIPPPNYQRGVVPKYLRNRQEGLQKIKECHHNVSHPDCPPGHVPLADSERKDTLRALRKNYSDLIHELNMMPVRTDTLKMKNRKIEIEKQLNRLEEAIKVFSKPQVFIKVGD